MEEYLIYKLTFPNGKIYIGQTHHIRKNVNLRWKNGRGYVGTLVGNAIEKYSWKNVKKEIIEEHILTKEEANKKEINYIKEFSSWIGFSKNNGYNTTPGGDSNQIIPNPVYQIDFNYNIVGEFASVEDACKNISIDKVYEPAGTDYTDVYNSFLNYDNILNIRKD